MAAICARDRTVPFLLYVPSGRLAGPTENPFLFLSSGAEARASPLLSAASSGLLGAIVAVCERLPRCAQEFPFAICWWFSVQVEWLFLSIEVSPMTRRRKSGSCDGNLQIRRWQSTIYRTRRLKFAIPLLQLLYNSVTPVLRPFT